MSDNLADQLRALKAKGLTFSDCVSVFGVSAEDDVYVAAANRKSIEGELEVDAHSVRSWSSAESGDYVLAWLWISDDEL